ncbi:MAG: choline-sulfatase, partial [Chlamydiales bacterium]
MAETSTGRVLSGRGLATILALGLCGACSRGSQPGLPATLTPGSGSGFNVVVLTLDTTRADHLGCYGHAGAKTPAIDGLAASGVRFADAVTVAPMTLPSHATIFTGLTPPRHGVRDNSEYRLAAEHVTLAETMKDAGYDTAAFLSAFVLDARFGLDQGFDVYDDRLSSSAAYGDFAERSGREVTDAAIKWLAKRPADAPFLCWVHYFDPHFPYGAPSALGAASLGEAYDAEITSMDREIGRLLQALETHGQRQKTIVLAVADHGESLGEHDEATHGMLIYEAVMHVPLILSCPALIDGSHVVDDAVVSTADIVPTLLALLGIDDDQTRDGVNLLANSARPDRVAYMEAMAPYLQNGWSPLHGLRRHADKYIHAPRKEYYDLHADPTEWNNLFGSSAATGVSDLESEMDRRLADAPDLAGSDDSRQQLGLQELAMLESLGYAAGVDPEERTGLEDPKDMITVLKDVGRAESLINQGKLQEALLVTESTVRRSPGHRRVLLNQATVLAMLGRNDEALATLETFTAIRPSADAYLLMGQIHIGQGRISAGQRALAQARQLEPRHGGIAIAQGDIYALQG